MPTEPLENPAAQAALPAKAGIIDLGLSFLHIGASTFGGMWAATRKLEDLLVQKKGWLSPDELKMLMVAATLIPAPKFMAFGAMVGFRLRGWAGSLTAVTCLVAPGAAFVLLGVVLLNRELLGTALEPVQRAVGIAVTGLLAGNAWHQLRAGKLSGRQQAIGIALALCVAAAAIGGVPLLLAAPVGLLLGGLLIRAGREGTK